MLNVKLVGGFLPAISILTPVAPKKFLFVPGVTLNLSAVCCDIITLFILDFLKASLVSLVIVLLSSSIPKLLGIVIDVNLVHSSNALFLIVCKLLDSLNFIDSRLVHFLNALLPMVVTLLGISIFFKLSHSSNTLSPNVKPPPPESNWTKLKFSQLENNLNSNSLISLPM